MLDRPFSVQVANHRWFGKAREIVVCPRTGKFRWAHTKIILTPFYESGQPLESATESLTQGSAGGSRTAGSAILDTTRANSEPGANKAPQNNQASYSQTRNEPPEIQSLTDRTANVHINPAHPMWHPITSTPQGTRAPTLDSPAVSVVQELGRSIAESLSGASAASEINRSILSNIKTFKGETGEFPTWRLSIEAAKAIVSEAQLYAKLMASLGNFPAQHLKTRRDVNSVDTALAALAERYDPIGDPLLAADRYNKLKQGGKDIHRHNEQMLACLSNMGYSVQCRDPIIINSYIHSLNDVRQREAIIRRHKQQKDLTLLDIMDMARTGQIAKEAAEGTSIDQESEEGNQIAFTLEEGEEGIAILRPHGRFQNRGFKRPYKPNNNGPKRNGNEYCAIHEKRSHNTADCRARNNDSCMYCKQPVQRGTLEQHVKNCTSPRCFNCDFRGHLAQHCKATTNRKGEQITKRQRRGNTHVAEETEAAAAPRTSASTACSSGAGSQKGLTRQAAHSPSCRCAHKQPQSRGALGHRCVSIPSG